MGKKLLIKESGLFINIPGIPKFRTPAKIDISRVDENLIIAELKKHGVKTYQIFNEKYEEKPVVEKKKIVESIPIVNNYYINSESENLKEDIKNQQKSIDNIEKLLQEFLTSKPKINKKIEDKKKIEIDEPEDFIPAIDIGKIKSNIK